MFSENYKKKKKKKKKRKKKKEKKKNVVYCSLMFKVMHRALDNMNKHLKLDNTRVVQKVLSLIGFLSIIPGIF